MEIRYLGFEQRQNFRVFRFDVHTEGCPTREALVTADIAVFRTHSVGIQEGPTLSGRKLTADLARGWDGEHEVTSDDLQAYTDAKALADAQRAGARKPPRRRPAAQGDPMLRSPWRNGM